MSNVSATAVLKGSRPWFEQFRATNEFCEQYEQIRKVVDKETHFNRGEAKWFLEAWQLKEYALIVEASSARLNRHDPPDGYVQIGDRTIGIELTEVLEPSRKRGLEFRPGVPAWQFDPVERWVERANIIRPALLDRIQAKQSRRIPYPPGTELFIYLNISEYGIRQHEVEREIRNILERDSAPFAAIHVLWNEKLFSSTGETRNHPYPQYPEAIVDDEELFRSVFEESE